MALPLAQQQLEFIIQACQQEAKDKRSQESGYCFELFRRAVEDDDQPAWEALRKQYERLVIEWLRRSAAGPILPQELDDLVQDAYSKFWLSLKRRPLPLSSHFAHVGALLKYFNRCALTTCLDAQRRQQKQDRIQQKLIQLDGSDVRADPLLTRLDESDQHDQLAQVRRWIQKEVSDPLEKLALRLLYEDALKPREIVARYPEQFPDAHAVRRVKARVLQRAKRALVF